MSLVVGLIVGGVSSIIAVTCRHCLVKAGCCNCCSTICKKQEVDEATKKIQEHTDIMGSLTGLDSTVGDQVGRSAIAGNAGVRTNLAGTEDEGVVGGGVGAATATTAIAANNSYHVRRTKQPSRAIRKRAREAFQLSQIRNSALSIQEGRAEFARHIAVLRQSIPSLHNRDNNMYQRHRKRLCERLLSDYINVWEEVWVTNNEGIGQSLGTDLSLLSDIHKQWLSSIQEYCPRKIMYSVVEWLTPIDEQWTLFVRLFWSEVAREESKQELLELKKKVDLTKEGEKNTRNVMMRNAIIHLQQMVSAARPEMILPPSALGGQNVDGYVFAYEMELQNTEFLSLTRIVQSLKPIIHLSIFENATYCEVSPIWEDDNKFDRKDLKRAAITGDQASSTVSSEGELYELISLKQQYFTIVVSVKKLDNSFSDSLISHNVKEAIQKTFTLCRKHPDKCIWVQYGDDSAAIPLTLNARFRRPTNPLCERESLQFQSENYTIITL